MRMLARLDAGNDLPFTLPNPGLTTLVRPLAVPLALAALAIGFVLWRFMGDVPGALKIGLSVILEAVLRRNNETREIAVQRPLLLPGEAAMDALKARDPSFTEDGFLQQASAIAQALVHGWLQKDLTACRDVMTADCWRFQQAQLSRGLAEGWRRFPADITPSAQQLLSAKLDTSGDSITIRIHMSPPPAAMKAVRGRRVVAWVEDWTFSRTASPIARVGARPTFGSWMLDRIDHVAVRFDRAA